MKDCSGAACVDATRDYAVGGYAGGYIGIASIYVLLNVLFDRAQNQGTTDEKKSNETHGDNSSRRKKKRNGKQDEAPYAEHGPPNVTYPGDDPTVPPGDNYSWHGKYPISDGKGAWVNEKTGETWHPDLDHGYPKGPHWDYMDINEIVWSVFSDGRILIWRD